MPWSHQENPFELKYIISISREGAPAILPWDFWQQVPPFEEAIPAAANATRWSIETYLIERARQNWGIYFKDFQGKAKRYLGEETNRLALEAKKLEDTLQIQTDHLGKQRARLQLHLRQQAVAVANLMIESAGFSAKYALKVSPPSAHDWNGDMAIDKYSQLLLPLGGLVPQSRCKAGDFIGT